MNTVLWFRRRGWQLLGTLALAVFFVAAWTWLLLRPMPAAAGAAGAIRYVAGTGADTGACTDPNQPCATLQYAVDMASDGDEIRVAAGTYVGVQERGGMRQIAFLDKVLTVRGGYNATTWEWNQQANPTTLDAQGLGRALVISGTGTLTDRVVIGGFRVTGGRGVSATLLSGLAAELLAALSPDADYTLLATTDAPGAGGAYVHDSAVTFQHMDFYQNLAGTSMSSPHLGGAAVLYNSDVCFESTTLRDNVANPNYSGSGGALYAYGSVVHLDHTVIENNTASTSQTSPGYGGGMVAQNSQVRMDRAQFRNNRAGDYNQSLGGGLLSVNSTIVIHSSQFTGNTASSEDRGYGGGLYGAQSRYTIQHNVFSYNVATSDADAVGFGGATYFLNTAVTLDSNILHHNSAGPGSNTFAGAVAVEQSATLTATLTYSMTNNVVISNTATTAGGWYVRNLSPDVPATTWIINNTFADNGDYAIVTYDRTHTIFVNNLLAHNGIYMNHNTATIVGSHNLYWPTRIVGGPGDIQLTDELTGDPTFVNPQALNYDIGYDSAAKDAGTNAWLNVVDTDINGQSRPYRVVVDIGAHEHTPALYLPVLRHGM